jgi:hypothetical protein
VPVDAPGFPIFGFGTDRRASILGIWAAPGARKTLPNGRHFGPQVVGFSRSPGLVCRSATLPKHKFWFGYLYKSIKIPAQLRLQGVRLGSRGAFFCGFFQLGRPHRPLCRCAASRGAVLLGKSNRKIHPGTPAGLPRNLT